MSDHGGAESHVRRADREDGMMQEEPIGADAT